MKKMLVLIMGMILVGGCATTDSAKTGAVAATAGFLGDYSAKLEPGPDVVRIRFAITELKQSRPAVSAVTS